MSTGARSHEPLILALDQGTTSTRAMVFDPSGRPLSSASRELRQFYPRDGWVEHDPDEIFESAVAVMREAAAAAGGVVDCIAAVGLTNQRETTVLWDRRTGEPVHNAIVWQDRRTAPLCQRLREEGHEAEVQARTGLLLDPYFSATKLVWLLENVPDARARAARGELLFGTIDSWLIWRLTGRQVHATDITNASRTMLFNIVPGEWDTALLELFGVPASLLPDVRDCAADYGETEKSILGRAIPIAGVAGDQQAASFGQACFSPGMLKSTYGTGCFALLNTGDKHAVSRHKLLTTIAARTGGIVEYALEGSIFMAGATMQWLRDGLGLFADAAETAVLAAQAKGGEGVYLVPAFTGLGAPYWDPHARGAIVGLTRDTGRAEVVRAGLDSVCYQTRDLLEAMKADLGGQATEGAVRVDGGMVVNDWFLQRLADLLGRPVERPVVTETTALGAAYLAGLQAGVHASRADIARHWALDRAFEPQMGADRREALYDGWRRAVARTLSTAPNG